MKWNEWIRADETHVNAPWSGSKKNFRCGFCGYKFKIGDNFMMLFTNNMGKAPGNPLVCEKCFTTVEETREKWAEKWAVWKREEWWWFAR